MSKNESSINEYVLHLKIVADHLNAIGETIPNKDLILYGIGGLDSTYNPFMSSFTTGIEFVNFDVFQVNC